MYWSLTTALRWKYGYWCMICYAFCGESGYRQVSPSLSRHTLPQMAQTRLWLLFVSGVEQCEERLRTSEKLAPELCCFTLNGL